MLPPRPLRIALADHSSAVRAYIRDLIGGHDAMEVVAEAGTVADVEAIAEQTAPDGIILDIAMLGDGSRALRRMKAEHPTTWLVVLTNHADPHHRDVCLRIGADAFLDKSLEYERVVAELERLAADRGIATTAPSLGQLA